MKPSAFFLVLSLATNVVLAYWYWHNSAAKSLEVAPEPVAASGEKRTRAIIDFEALKKIDVVLAEAITSGDPQQLKDALVRAGFPPDYVRDIVTYHLGNTVSPDHLALLEEQAKTAFMGGAPGAEALALQMRIQENDAKNKEISKDIFGGKVPPHPLEALNQQRRYRFLPAEKIEAVTQIDNDYRELMFQNNGDRSSAVSFSPEKVKLLETEKRADLAKILSPAELELYDLHLSATAGVLRRELAAFQPTEEEFRGLYQVRQSVDEKYGTARSLAAPAEVERRRALNEQVRTLLGEQRFAEYERGQNYGYRVATEIVAHYNLPAANAAKVYAIQQSTLKQVADLRKAAGSNPAAVGTELKTLTAEATDKLTKLLGAPGIEAYKKTGGTWLAALEKPAGVSK